MNSLSSNIFEGLIQINSTRANQFFGLKKKEFIESVEQFEWKTSSTPRITPNIPFECANSGMMESLSSIRTSRINSHIIAPSLLSSHCRAH